MINSFKQTRHATSKKGITRSVSSSTPIRTTRTRTMLSTHLQFLALTLALVPSLGSAAIFPPNSHVKVLDVKGFKKAMKANVCFPFVLITIQNDFDIVVIIGNKHGCVFRSVVWCECLCFVGFFLCLILCFSQALSTNGAGVYQSCQGSPPTNTRVRR